MPKLFTVLCFLFLTAAAFAQQKQPVDLSRADEVALSTKYEGNLEKLTHQLTDPFPEKMLKVRAIFRWITDNIEYDYKFYNKFAYQGKDAKGFYCEGDSISCAVKLQVWQNDYVRKVLDSRKAVCQGYAWLFQKMCTIAEIPAEVVPGYIKTQYYEIGTAGNLDHAWNAVLIDNNWQLLDPTWAAGGCPHDENGKLTDFVKHYNEYYWLTPPEDFARNHFPEKPKWVLIPKYTKDNFAANAYYAPDELAKIKLLAPQSGLLAVKRGDTIRFKIAFTDPLKDIQINTNVFQNPDIWTLRYITDKKVVRVPDSMAMKKQQYIAYKKTGNIYEFAYPVKDNSLAYLDIMFDRKRVMRFKVKGH